MQKYELTQPRVAVKVWVCVRVDPLPVDVDKVVPGSRSIIKTYLKSTRFPIFVLFLIPVGPGLFVVRPQVVQQLVHDHPVGAAAGAQVQSQVQAHLVAGGLKKVWEMVCIDLV